MSGYEHCMRHQRDEDRTRLRIFFYLQLLDALTTLVGMRLGLGEASPVVRWLMAGSPVMGLLISKAIAFALCGICYWSGHRRVVGWINLWYAALVIWNLALMMVVLK